MPDKIMLGHLNPDLEDCPASGEVVWITKHQWDCGWYWAFGYLGNNRCHFHFESLIGVKKKGDYNHIYEVNKLFTETTITPGTWWVLLDLFKQAYALKEAAAVYQYGGHMTSRAGVTDILKNEDKARVLNEDLKLILDQAWAILEAIQQPALGLTPNF